MKIGTSIFLIVLILISFGYVISDDMNYHKKVAEVTGQLNNLNSRLDQANQKLNSCQATVQTDQVTISKLGLENASLKTANSQQFSRINSLDAQRGKCGNIGIQGVQASSGFSNMGLLIAIAILISLAAGAVFQSRPARQDKKISVQVPGSRKQAEGEYVRLSRQELAQLVNMRRINKR